jgi:hypothetical protein
MNPKRLTLGGFEMSYLRAEEILPKELLKEVQQYVNGQSVYIPAKEKSDWGSATDTKQILEVRNLEIYEKYRVGASVQFLAEEFVKTVEEHCRSLKQPR